MYQYLLLTDNGHDSKIVVNTSNSTLFALGKGTVGIEGIVTGLASALRLVACNGQ